MKRVSLLLIGLMLAGGCGPSTVRTQPSNLTSSSPPSTAVPPTSSTPQATPDPASGPAIVLTANLGAKPALWHLVARVPFGAEANQLGIVTDQRSTPAPDLPPSFAVAQDGTFWLADSVKQRLVQYSANGTFLGSVRGLYHDRHHPHAEDLVATRGGLDVVEARDFVSHITRFGQSGRLSSVRPAGHTIVYLLYATSQGVVGLLAGSYTGSGHIGSIYSADPQGFAGFDPPTSGEVHLLPGLPVGPDRWIGLRPATPTADQTFTLTYSSPESSVERPLRVRVIAGSGAKPLNASVGPSIQLALHSSVGMFVRLSTSDSNQPARGGSWYLQVGPGQPVIWERLPTSPIDDSRQVRHLAAGPNGSVYLMVADANGESIYRR